MINYDNNTKILTLAYYILENKTTIRATAKEFRTAVQEGLVNYKWDKEASIKASLNSLLTEEDQDYKDEIDITNILKNAIVFVKYLKITGVIVN